MADNITKGAVTVGERTAARIFALRNKSRTYPVDRAIMCLPEDELAAIIANAWEEGFRKALDSRKPKHEAHAAPKCKGKYWDSRERSYIYCTLEQDHEGRHTAGFFQWWAPLTDR